MMGVTQVEEETSFYSGHVHVGGGVAAAAVVAAAGGDDVAVDFRFSF